MQPEDRLLSAWRRIDTRTVRGDCLTDAEARAVSQSVFDLWNNWNKLRLSKPRVRALEVTPEFQRLKRQHQYWADEARKVKHRRDNADRQAKVRAGTWNWMDPERVRRRLRGRLDRVCANIITVLCSKEYSELEPVRPCWSSDRPDLAGHLGWLHSNDNRKLRTDLAGHLEELWDVSQQLGDLECLRHGPGKQNANGNYVPGTELYELDFLQTELFRQLREEALWRTGVIGAEEPPDDEPMWDEPEICAPVDHDDDPIEWGDPDPEPPVYQGEPMRRPRRVVEDEPDVLNDCQRRIQAMEEKAEAHAQASGRGLLRAPSLEELRRADAQEQARLFPLRWDVDAAMPSED